MRGVFSNTDIRNITLPDTLQDISNLSKIALLKNIYTSKNNPYYTSKNGVLFSKDMKTLCLYPTSHGKVYTVPDGVETINKSAFMVSIIEKVTFPKSLKTIKNSAFARCSNLKNVNFNEGLTSIELDAFEYCDQLCHIEFPSTLKTIYYSAFNGCDLRSVEIPKNVTEIYNYVFENNKKLESILVKGKTTNIYSSLFYSDTKITIYAPSNSTAEQYAKENNHEFVSTDLPKGATCKDHKYVFNKCLKQPDCLNYGVFSTKCAICSKAGPNKKVHSLDHAFYNRVCMYCNSAGNQTITAQYNQSVSCIIPTTYYYSTDKYITFIAPKDGKYTFNITNPNCKFQFELELNISDKYAIYHDTKYISKNYKQTLNLNKNNIVRIAINQIDDYTYYEPIKFNFKVSCGHSYKNTVVKPTYTSNGYTLHKCTTCNHSYKDKTTKKLTLPTPSGVTVKSQKKTFTVSYKKVAKAKGYQIQYSTSSNFKSAKTVKLTKNTTVKKTISKLSSKKKYFIRVRSYVVQNKKTAYSNWSKTKSIKTK